jgi:hypothetical protein
MIELIRQHRDEIAAICREHGVRRLEVFGSAARDDFRPGESDIDFIAEFDVTPAAPGVLTRYLAVAEALEDVLHTPVELLTPASIRNPYLRQSVDACKEPVYAA